LNLRILSSTSVPFTLTTVQVLNLALTHKKRITVGQKILSSLNVRKKVYVYSLVCGCRKCSSPGHSTLYKYIFIFPGNNIGQQKHYGGGWRGHIRFQPVGREIIPVLCSRINTSSKAKYRRKFPHFCKY
jgi:hypothetical protein